MIGYIVTAIVFSIPSIYYRKKLKECQDSKRKIIENSWKWQDWGE